MFANYAWAQVMVLRRLTEMGDSRNGRSMRRLLADLQSNCCLLTREAIVAFWAGVPIRSRRCPEWSDRCWQQTLERYRQEFEDLAGGSALSISSTIIGQYLATLESVHEKIKEFVDKTLAHLDKRELLSQLTMADLDSLIDTTIDVFHFVHRVTTGFPRVALPRDNHNWDQVLEFAWKTK